MKTNRPAWLLAACLLSISMFTACSIDADLCDAVEHPHVGKVSYAFNWGDYAEEYSAKGKSLPDSMYIIATRVVNHWKTAMVVSSAVDKPNRGYFVFNAPEYETTVPDTPQEPENPEPEDPKEPSEPNPPVIPGHSGGKGTNAPAKHDDETRADDTENTGEDVYYKPALTRIGAERAEFPIRTGAYKFVAFNMDTTKFVYNKVVEYMLDPTSDRKLQDMYVEYKTYDKGDKQLDYDDLPDWQDYNSYSNYMQPNVTPIFIDTIASRQIEKGKVPVQFRPEPMTQHLDIYFNIKKDNSKTPFVIDDVRAEISGIPTRIYFANGNMDIRNTAKMMFRTDLCDVATGNLINGTGVDSPSTTTVRCHGNIDVTTVVQSNNKDITTGPGILQVIIYTHVETGEANPPRKKIQGKINLYNTLKNSNLMDYTEDGNFAIRNGNKGVINIVADVTIDGEEIVLNKDNTGGIDEWKKSEQIDIDI